jgi:uncharacterized lipoprotein YddW (UPF0748 family)
MTSSPFRWRRHPWLAWPAIVALAASAWPGSALRARDDVRALWVVRTTLESPATVAAMVSGAAAAGFNTLIVQVRGRGDAYYSGGLEPRPPSLADRPAFDPLAETVARARLAGLQVHAWVNVNLVSSAVDLPASRDHVVYRHPDWLMVPRSMAAELSAVDATSPEYLERLARFVQSQPATLEGLYVSPVAPAAGEYAARVAADIVRRYGVDGIHLDYLRYPSEDFDYSRAALAAFRQHVAGDLTPEERARYDSRIAAEPTVYADAFPGRWHGFRSSQLTRLVATIRESVKAIRPTAVVSAAVFPDPDEAADRRLQDWRGWLARGLLDIVCPMAYTTDADVFASQVAAAHAIAGTDRLWAGIGAFRLASLQIAANVRTARRLGAGGVVLFSYDSLAAPERGPSFLLEVGQAAFSRAGL